MIRYVDDTKKPPRVRTADQHSGPVQAGTILLWVAESLGRFDFGDSMAKKVRFLRRGINMEANVHANEARPLEQPSHE